MKRNIILVLVLILHSGLNNHKLFAQWVLNSFVPDSSFSFGSIDMLNENEGYIISYNHNTFVESILYHTTDGWNTSDTTHFNILLDKLDFVSPDTGFLTGSYNAFYYTYNGGQNWQNLPSNCFAPYVIYPNDVAFLNAKYGAVAVAGLDLRTKDYGQTWYRDTGDLAGAEYISFENGIFMNSSGYCSIDTFQTSFVLMPNTLGFGHGRGVATSGQMVALAIMGQDGFLFNHPYVNFGIMAVANLNNQLCNIYHLFEIHSPLRIEYTGNSIYTYGGFRQGQGIPLIGHFIKSPNDGQNWYKQYTNLPNGSISSNIGILNNISCPTENTCYALFSTQLYKTTNGGGPLIEEIGSFYETQTTLSMNQNEQSLTSSFSPNPCTTSLRINSTETPFSYEFFNLNGQQILSGQSTSKELNVSTLLPGMYFVKVKDRNGLRTGKVVKLE